SVIAMTDHCSALAPAAGSPVRSRFQAARQRILQNRACSRRGTNTPPHCSQTRVSAISTHSPIQVAGRIRSAAEPGRRTRTQWPDRGSGSLKKSLCQAVEAGDETIQAGQGEDTVNGAVRGDDQPQLAAFAKGPLVCPDQDTEATGITEPSAGHIHHD